MSTLKVYTFAAYFTGEWEEKPSDDTFHATKFVKAIKGDKVNRYAYVPVPDGTRTVRRYLDAENQRAVFAWFGAIAAPFVQPLASSPLALVPIPSSSATSRGAVEDSNPHRLAVEIAKRLSRARVEPILWWDRPMPSARKAGGPRDPAVLYRHLVVGRPTQTSGTFLLVDDVCTSGGHLLAAEAKLSAVGRSIDLGVCAGRTVDLEEPNPFEWVEREFVRFRPARK